MFRKPFSAQNTTITDQGCVTTSPTTLGANQVLVTQDQQRRIFDATTTSIRDMFPNTFNYNGNVTQQPDQQRRLFDTTTTTGEMFPNSFNYNGNVMQQPSQFLQQPPQFWQHPPQAVQQPQQFLQAERHFTPYGVVYTFNPSCMQTSQGVNFNSQPGWNFNPQQTYQQPYTLQQQIALNAVEKHGLESILMQEQMNNNQFHLRFHHDKNTSTSDLLPGPSQMQESRGLPDFQNLSGIVEQMFSEYVSCHCDKSQKVTLGSTSIKRLSLTKSPDLTAENKEIVIEEDDFKPVSTSTPISKPQLNVKFDEKQDLSEDNTKNKDTTTQTKIKPKKQKFKKRKKKSSNCSSESSSTESDEDEKEKSWRKRNDVESERSQSSISSKSYEARKRKTRKQKRRRYKK